MGKQKKYADVVSTDSRRSWFCVLNNPQKVFGDDMTPEEIVYKAIQLWIDEEPSRSCGVNYEISDSGTPHLHMVLEDARKARFSAIKKLYGETIHIEPTKGSKQQALAYITKEAPFKEKEHTVVVPAVIVGSIQSNRKNGSINICDEIDAYIDEGLTPKQIMSLSSRFRKEEAVIRKAYFAKREAETPPKRDVEVIWHVGSSGTGKSYTYVQLCEQYGEEHVYMMSDYQNGGLDWYCGERILFMDELREMTYTVLLGMIEGLKKQIHCRYANALSLWTEVHITSIYPPEECYERMVPKDQRQRDSLEQLMRRISKIIYHYKEHGEFKSYSIDRADYKSYSDLINRATNPYYKHGFQTLTDEVKEGNPFVQENLTLEN